MAAKKKGSKKRKKKVVSKAAGPAPNKEAKADENKGSGSGVKIDKLAPPKQARVKPGKRLYLNAAKDTLYPEGHAKAATLYCTEHKFVPRKEYESLKKGK